MPGFARGAVEWHGSVVLASGRTRLIRRDPDTLRPLEPHAELLAPGGAVDREDLTETGLVAHMQSRSQPCSSACRTSGARETPSQEAL